MYESIETTDEGDVVMAKIVEHLRAVEAGCGKNVWVNQRLEELVEEAEEREISHVEIDEFAAIIEDISEAGWSVRMPAKNERISDMDLRHVFEKVDTDGNHKIDDGVS